MSRLSRVLFPDDYTVFEVGCNPGLSNKRQRLCPSNDDVVTMSVLEQTSCLAQLAGPDVPKTMKQKTSHNTRREERDKQKGKPKRRALRAIDKNSSNRNIDKRTNNDVVTKPQNNRPKRVTAGSINRPRRVTAESMDILGQIGNLDLDGFSNFVRNEHDKNKHIPRTRRTRSTSDKEIIELVSTSLVPAQCSPPISSKPKKRKETKKTPAQLCQEKNKKEDCLENIIWHSLSSTIRKKRKREQNIAQKSNDSMDKPNTDASECNGTSSFQQVTPCSELRDGKNSNSSSPLDVTEKVNEPETHQTSEASNEKKRNSKRKSQKRLPLSNNNNDNSSNRNVSSKPPSKKRKQSGIAASLSENVEQISLRRSSRRRCPTDRLVDHIPLEHENSNPKPKQEQSLEKSSRNVNDSESDVSPVTLRKSKSKKKSVERLTVNHEDSMAITAEESRDKWLSLVKTPTLRCKKPSKQQKKLKTQQQPSDDDDDIFNSTPIRDAGKNKLEKSSQNESKSDASPVTFRKSTRRKKSVERLTVNHDEKNHESQSEANVVQCKGLLKTRKQSDNTTNDKKVIREKAISIIDSESIDVKSSADHWDETSLNQLLKAHKETDPKCYFFWHQIASKVPCKSAEECRDKWFSLVKTPTLRRKKPSNKQDKSQTQQQRSNDDDDIFHSTPIRDAAKLILSWHKSSSARNRRRSRRSSTSFSDILSSPVLKKYNSCVYNKEVDKEIPSPLQFRKMTKCYVKKVRAGLADTKSKSQMMKKSYNVGGSKKRRKLLSAEVDAGDVHMDGFLSPNGTLTIKAPEEHEVGDLYFPSEDENEEYEDSV